MRMNWGLAVNQSGLGNRVIFAVASIFYNFKGLTGSDRV